MVWSMRICVVTRVPDPETDDGNLAAAIVYRLPSEVRVPVLLRGRVPVFHLGEILILDESGREVGGLGRKPSKWDVALQYFPTIEEAVEKSRAVSGSV